MAGYIGITNGSISCYCDRFIGTYQTSLLSLFGKEAVVTALAAAFVGGSPLEVEGQREYLWRPGVKIRILTRKQDGVVHKIIFSPETLYGKGRPGEEKVVWGETPEEAKDKIWKLIDRSVSTPLSPDWKEGVYYLLKETDSIREISIFGFGEEARAYLVKIPGEEELEEFIKEHLL